MSASTAPAPPSITSNTPTGAFEALKERALTYPGAWEDHPWEDTVYKVAKKVFLFSGRVGDELHLSVKLPLSGAEALGFPFTAPAGYGLGKSGWVSASFAPGDEIPVPLLLEWLDESYRAVAPKRAVAALETAGQGQ
jgi:predicted DNA-binding protein (MmcQ/YjbR family)